MAPNPFSSLKKTVVADDGCIIQRYSEEELVVLNDIVLYLLSDHSIQHIYIYIRCIYIHYIIHTYMYIYISLHLILSLHQVHEISSSS